MFIEWKKVPKIAKPIFDGPYDDDDTQSEERRTNKNWMQWFEQCKRSAGARERPESASKRSEANKCGVYCSFTIHFNSKFISWHLDVCERANKHMRSMCAKLSLYLVFFSTLLCTCVDVCVCWGTQSSHAHLHTHTYHWICRLMHCFVFFHSFIHSLVLLWLKCMSLYFIIYAMLFLVFNTHTSHAGTYGRREVESRHTHGSATDNHKNWRVCVNSLC